MQQTKYLIVGSSHAALEALAVIRVADPDGTLTVLTRDNHLPYSPTILPYVVSGRSQPEKVRLRDEDFFAQRGVAFHRGATVVAVDPKARQVALASRERWQYEKLLLATGASPSLPPVKGLSSVRYHMLRTLDDAIGLREAMGKAQRAVVLGAGLVGMHAAESLAKRRIKVTVVERQGGVLPGYFDQTASDMIRAAFEARGVAILTGRSAVEAEPAGDGAIIHLDDGQRLETDFLLVAAGVRPEMGFLQGTGVATDRGILVDDFMRTNDQSIWAAGDVAQARGFFNGDKVVNGILPEAVEQGRIAGAAMAGDTTIKPYCGGVPLNTYGYFGQQALSVGTGIAGEPPAGAEITTLSNPAAGTHTRIALADNRLLGIATINQQFDPGVMWQLIRRRIDLGPVKQQFLDQPLLTGRQLMSKYWR